MLDIRDYSIAERIRNMDISRRFFIHFKGGIAISEQCIFVFNGNHIFFDHYGIFVPAVNFDIACSQINTE